MTGRIVVEEIIPWPPRELPENDPPRHDCPGLRGFGDCRVSSVLYFSRSRPALRSRMLPRAWGGGGERRVPPLSNIPGGRRAHFGLFRLQGDRAAHPPQPRPRSERASTGLPGTSSWTRAMPN
jgi:hypothetical protein